ncbi:MAG: glycosyltransferase family 2 protein [Bacteroidales bacterium]|nr:glycosyltransferase family 2 protein [Bacteroidales bacterium]MCF8404532.1 glycosyltransferase family 2 protein [Bacteroidales bacterium]
MEIKNIEYSVVIPVYNSENTLQELFKQLYDYFISFHQSFEVIFVDDGSKDKSWNTLNEIHNAYPEYTSIIRLNKNYGQHNATFCGMDVAKGQYIITIDDDLQTPPKEITKLIDTLKSDKEPDLVYGYYKDKKHSRVRNFGSRLLKLYTKHLFKAPGKGSSFRLFTREINEQIKSHKSTMIFIDELLLWYAGNIMFTEVIHQKSDKSKSGYNLPKLIRLFINVILYSTATPLKIMIYGGFFFAILNFIIGIVFMYRKMVYNVPLGYTSIIVTILFSTGILLFFLGIIGKYLGRIFSIQNKKPPYLIKRKHNRKAAKTNE